MTRESVDSARIIEDELRLKVTESLVEGGPSGVLDNPHPLAAPILLVSEKLEAILQEMIIQRPPR